MYDDGLKDITLYYILYICLTKLQLNRYMCIYVYMCVQCKIS